MIVMLHSTQQAKALSPPADRGHRLLSSPWAWNTCQVLLSGKMKDSELLDLIIYSKEELSSYLGIPHVLGYPTSGRN
jgi:hypothetical protein